MASPTTTIPNSTSVGPEAQPASGRGVRARPKAWLTLPVAYLYLVWFVVILDPHRWIAERGLRISAMNSALSLIALPLIPMVLARLPKLFQSTDRPVVYAPFLGFVLVTVATLGSAMYSEWAWNAVKIFIVYWIIVVATILYIRTARQVVPLIVLYAGQFWWWGWHSGKTGAVWWHPTLANYDTYGPLVLMGLSITFCFALASKSKWYRYGGFFLAVFCSLALVTSFARGVGLSAVLVAALLWWRSPYKGRATVGLIGGAVTVLLTSAILFPNNAFWLEMQSSFTEGTVEGTGNDRWELWKIGWAVFEDAPIVGVGAEHAGHHAYQMVKDRKLVPGGVYLWMPWALQGRQLHNVYVQILAEHGAVGMLMYLLLVADFWRRNRKLRTRPFRRRWAQGVNGRFDLRLLAIGVEGAMVAYLATAFFYTQLYQHWFFTLLTLNLLLYTFSQPLRQARPRSRQRSPASPSPRLAVRSAA